VPSRRVLVLAGELDVLSAPLLKDALTREPLDADLVVALNEVTFVDSAALGQLVAHATARRAAGSGLVLLGATDAVCRVLALTHLDDVLPVARSLEDVDRLLPGSREPAQVPRDGVGSGLATG